MADGLFQAVVDAVVEVRRGGAHFPKRRRQKGVEVGILARHFVTPLVRARRFARAAAEAGIFISTRHAPRAALVAFTCDERMLFHFGGDGVERISQAAAFVHHLPSQRLLAVIQNVAAANLDG